MSRSHAVVLIGSERSSFREMRFSRARVVINAYLIKLLIIRERLSKHNLANGYASGLAGDWMEERSAS